MIIRKMIIIMIMSLTFRLWKHLKVSRKELEVLLVLSAPVHTFTNMFLHTCAYSHAIRHLWVNTGVFLGVWGLFRDHCASSAVLFPWICFCPSNASSG